MPKYSWPTGAGSMASWKMVRLAMAFHPSITVGSSCPARTSTTGLAPAGAAQPAGPVTPATAAKARAKPVAPRRKRVAPRH